jgi:hypothetical protein
MQQPELALPTRYVPPATAPAHLPFDYGALNTGAATQLKSCADTIRSYQNKVPKQIIAIGDILLAVKKALDHGQFGEWLAAEFGWSERTAQNYMRAAETFSDKCETVADLPPTTLYQLAAPSTPEPVCAAVVERLERGERVTHDEIKSMVRKGKADAKAVREDEKRTPEQRAKRQKAEEQRQRDQARRRAESDAELGREMTARREPRRSLSNESAKTSAGLSNYSMWLVTFMLRISAKLRTPHF